MELEDTLPTVGNLPLERPLFCKPTDKISDVATLMSSKRRYCVLVRKDDKLEGVITTKDLAFKSGTLSKDILSRTPVLTPNSMCVSDALEIMVERKIRHLPIVDSENGEIVGILDITKCLHQAVLKLEAMARDSAKLNDAIQDVIGNEATQTRQRLLHDIANLIDQMETPSLESILNSEVYNTTPVFVNPTATVAEAMQLMATYKTTAVLVHDSPSMAEFRQSNDCNIIGIFTSKDYVCRVLNHIGDIDPLTCTLTRVMTARPNFAFKGLGLHSALRMMYEGRFLNLPVIDDSGTILGLISVLQLTHAALSCQLATRTKSINTFNEPYISIRKSEPVDVQKLEPHDANDMTFLSASDLETPDVQVNYFWKSFDASDNESVSSSQLSLVDLTQTVCLGNVNASQKSNDQFAGRRSSTLLHKKFFENGKHSKYKFKISIKNMKENKLIGTMKFKTFIQNSTSTDMLTRIADKVKSTYEIDSNFCLQYEGKKVATSELLCEHYESFISIHGVRTYMPLQFVVQEKTSRYLDFLRELFSSTSLQSLFKSTWSNANVKTCLAFFSGFIVGRILK